MSDQPPTAHAIDGAPFSVGIVAARYNPVLVEKLLERVLAGLEEAGVKSEKIKVVRVPGSNELATACQWLVRRHSPAVVVALGVVVRGDTRHHELVATTSSQGLQRVALDTGVAVINGVVVTENFAQAKARCGGRLDRGGDFARAAVEMAALRRRLSP